MKISSEKSLRQKGTTIMEMMAVVALLGVFMLIAAELFTTSTKLAGESARASEAHLTASLMLRTMRDDAWAADSIAIDETNAAWLTQPGGRTILWTVHRPGRVTRSVTNESDPEPMITVYALPTDKLTFHHEGFSLQMRTPGHPRPNEASFVSQLMMARQLESKLADDASSAEAEEGRP